MSFQKNDQSDFDFSIIDKKPPQQAKLNFSVQSLLSQHQRDSQIQEKQTTKNRTNQLIARQNLENEQTNKVQAHNGSFLQDLQKLEQQLSYETQLYNVYQQETQTCNSNTLNALTKSFLHAKSNSYLKTTKQQSNSHSVDDYGYLVLDFGTKRKKSSKLHQNQKYNSNYLKTYTQQQSSHKLKSSRSSNVYTQIANEQILKQKSNSKRNSLNKLFSPKPIKNKNNLTEKQKNTLKSVSKNKDLNKQIKHSLNKITKKLSKSKSPSNKLNFNQNNSKNTNISTTIGETSTKTNKSTTKSMKQGNAYSQYYGFQQIGTSQRFITKSNCLSSSGSQKNIKTNSKKLNNTQSTNQSKSRSNCKQKFNSPSHKQLAMRFKKKKSTHAVK